MSEHEQDAAPFDRNASDEHSVHARQSIRSRLAADVEAFLAQGGSIEEVPDDYRADPPRRPQGNYGHGSL